MTESQPADAIMRTVLAMLETGGQEAVQLREVARRAQVSLTTIYKFFPTRDDLIIAAVERWMAANSCAELDLTGVEYGLYEGLMHILRHVFEPWERSPRMLEIFHQVQTWPGGERLLEQTYQAIEPAAMKLFVGYDPHYIEDLSLILTHLAFGAVARFAAQEISATDVLPILERTVYRLTIDNSAAANRITSSQSRCQCPTGGGADG